MVNVRPCFPQGGKDSTDGPGRCVHLFSKLLLAVHKTWHNVIPYALHALELVVGTLLAWRLHNTPSYVSATIKVQDMRPPKSAPFGLTLHMAPLDEDEEDEKQLIGMSSGAGWDASDEEAEVERYQLMKQG